jgi:hypothetical protein
MAEGNEKHLLRPYYRRQCHGLCWAGSGLLEELQLALNLIHNWTLQGHVRTNLRGRTNQSKGA